MHASLLFFPRAFAICLIVFMSATQSRAAEKLKLLIVDGQNNHNWKETTPILKSFLEKTNRFEVEVATSPPRKSSPAAWEKFRPNFQDFDVVLSNYNGELWPKPVQENLESYVKKGGALVVVHAANNAFPQWIAWNKMIGLGWRNNKYGDRITFDDNGKIVRTKKGTGPGASHGPQHEFTIVVRDRKHPVMKDIPVKWKHSKDELYHGQRGPALNMHILATAFSAKEKRGTGTNEPMVWWIPYGKGRVFTTVMGHAGYSMKCVGFRTIVSRGCEWASTGKVTLPIPDQFPSAKKPLAVDE